MTRIAALSIATLAAALAATPAVAAGPFYWSSFEAEQAVVHSDWGDARGVDNVKCAGKGKWRQGTLDPEYTTFRCDLADSQFRRIGFITVKTTGPEAWRPVGFIAPRCPAR